MSTEVSFQYFLSLGEYWSETIVLSVFLSQKNITLVSLSCAILMSRCHKFEKVMETSRGDFINRFINKGQKF